MDADPLADLSDADDAAARIDDKEEAEEKPDHLDMLADDEVLDGGCQQADTKQRTVFAKHVRDTARRLVSKLPWGLPRKRLQQQIKRSQKTADTFLQIYSKHKRQ